MVRAVAKAKSAAGNEVAPLPHEYEPMEAQLVQSLPSGDNWQYEPKWDGFRCIAFKQGDEIYLRSKNGQPLARYFPEVVQSIKSIKAKEFVVDGELIIVTDKGPSFDDLLQRIHPAESRIRKLSKETPAAFVVFDLLVDSTGKLLVDQSLENRRKALETFSGKFLQKRKDVLISPATDDVTIAQRWLDKGEAMLDGVMAKRTDLPYQSGNRKGMVKVKRLRTADCVIGGFRYGSSSNEVASLLLGLYDDEGELHHVGFTSALASEDKKSLTSKLKKLSAEHSFTVNVPGGPSRWSTKRGAEWVPIKPQLVIEVQYDHFTGGRFRHGTRLLRWRPEKKPRQCTLDQIEATASL